MYFTLLVTAIIGSQSWTFSKITLPKSQVMRKREKLLVRGLWASALVHKNISYEVKFNIAVCLCCQEP